MSDNTRLNLGEGGDLYAADELATVNGQAAEAGLKVQQVKVGFGADGELTDVTPDAPLPVHDDDVHFLLLRMLQLLGAPAGYDKALGRQRSTTVLESGTVTTVTTVTTLTTCATVTNLSTIDTLQGRLLVLGQNAAAWQSCVRSRIS